MFGSLQHTRQLTPTNKPRDKSFSRVPARFSTQGSDGLCAMLQVNFAWTLATSEDLKHPTTDGERSDSWAADAFAAYFQQVMIADQDTGTTDSRSSRNNLLQGLVKVGYSPGTESLNGSI